MNTCKPKENKSTNVKLVTQYISAGQNLSSCNLIIIFGKHIFFNKIKTQFQMGAVVWNQLYLGI